MEYADRINLMGLMGSDLRISFLISAASVGGMVTLLFAWGAALRRSRGTGTKHTRRSIIAQFLASAAMFALGFIGAFAHVALGVHAVQSAVQLHQHEDLRAIFEQSRFHCLSVLCVGFLLAAATVGISSWNLIHSRTRKSRDEVPGC